MASPGIDWVAVQGFIRNWLIGATGLPADSVGWADQDRERAKYPYATLNILTDDELGIDELVYEYDSGQDALIEHATGVREFTVTIKIETNSQNPDPASQRGANSRYYLTKARSNLRHSATKEAFDAAGLAIVTVEKTLNLETVRALGIPSVGVLDLRLATLVDDFDAETPTSYIDKASISGTLDVPPSTTIGPDMYGDTD